MSSNITFGTFFSTLDFPPQDLISLLQIFFSMLIMTGFILGNFANGFIALVNCIDWIKKHKISCADRILTALAVSRIGLLCVLVLNWYATVFNLPFYSSEVRTTVFMAWIVNHHFCLWLATSLSILYFLKIANFSCLLFLHLKWRAERVVIMILWGNLFILVCHLTVASIDEKMKMNDYEGNATWKTNLRDSVRLSSMTVLTLANFIPLTMSLTAVLLLIFSLWKHLKNMQLSGKGTQDPSTEVHIRAMQTVISFFLLFVIYFLAQIIPIWRPKTLQNNSVLMLCEVLGIMHPSTHSLILIWGNKKLRRAFLSFLWQLRCWLKEKK
ncbi:taste receptor type 2 member 50-like [Myotis myotis]|uniref:taste receptor type 2 member 50-like n=1 Tax=Myotis myotis TaxID=51298 RepID=UPI00174D3160|nr:taste receptor type 2 member 50-like [Myotis myotis]